MGCRIPQIIWSISVAGTGLCCAWLLAACGMAAAPQPPSLHLPRQVRDLKGVRSGNTVELSWTSPKQTTDRLKLTDPVTFTICRKEKSSSCQTVATTTGIPGKPASYTEQLAAGSATGPLRPTTYFINGMNKKNRSAGPSNAATVLLGATPPAIADLTASMTARGVVLCWQAVPAWTAGTQIQLHRTLLPQRGAAKKNSSTHVSAEPLEQTLAVTPGKTEKQSGVALDTEVQFDRTYRYTANRVVTLQVDKQNLQAASSSSHAVTITTRDTFPPGAPTGLAAVPVSAAMNGARPEVDLSWSLNAEPDLAQYRVYRQETGTQTNAQPERIGPGKDAEPLIAPAFRDMHVHPGQTYTYTVTAMDAAGNESAPSTEVRVTVPKI